MDTKLRSTPHRDRGGEGGELATFNLQLAATGVAPGRLGDRRPIRPVWPVKQAV